MSTRRAANAFERTTLTSTGSYDLPAFVATFGIRSVARWGQQLHTQSEWFQHEALSQAWNLGAGRSSPVPGFMAFALCVLVAHAANMVDIALSGGSSLCTTYPPDTPSVAIDHACAGDATISDISIDPIVEPPPSQPEPPAKVVMCVALESPAMAAKGCHPAAAREFRFHPRCPEGSRS